MRLDPFAEVLGYGRGSDRKDAFSAHLKLVAIINDAQALRDHVAALDGTAPSSLRALHPADLLARGALSREVKGLKIVGLSGHFIDQDASSLTRVSVVVEVAITDPEALTAQTLERYERLWGHVDFDPTDLAKLIYEALVASNEMPSPDTIGIEIDCSEDAVTIT